MIATDRGAYRDRIGRGGVLVYAGVLAEDTRAGVPSWAGERALHEFQRADRLERLLNRLSDGHGGPR